MKAYLAYAAEYMECGRLIGVYSNDEAARLRAKAEADLLDERERLIFSDDKDWDFIPATWWVTGMDVLEE